MLIQIQDDLPVGSPITETAVRMLHPDISFPVPLTATNVEPLGYALYEATPPPVTSWSERAVEVSPTQNAGGVWLQTWATEMLAGDDLVQAHTAHNECLKRTIVAATQERLDAFARTRNYDDIKSACGYAGCSVVKFDTEGSYCRDARAETWAVLYGMLAEVEAGTRPLPTSFADVEPLLPELVWPN